MKKNLLILIGALLVFNGFINVVDNGRVLAYDITSILSGSGFLIIAVMNRKA